MSGQEAQRSLLVFGASGLIGRYVTDDLRARGFHAIGIARLFAASQGVGALDLEMPILSLASADLARLIRDHAADTIVNCLGVLQDGPGSDTNAVHCDFVARLLEAIRQSGRTVRLIHISIPGDAREDRTAFATSKREAERLIAKSGIAHAILRPGFVIAPGAYGGGGLVRALAAIPFELPDEEAATPFQPVAIEDIAATVAWLAARDIGDAAVRAVTWNLMQPEPIALAGVIGNFRRAYGTAKTPRITLPRAVLDLGVRLGDLASHLGWKPPLRTTALIELRRGVAGDPAPWMEATGIVPTSIAQALARPACIQDKGFARLFLLKPLIITSLALFWTLSGFIALVVNFPATKAILATHDFPAWLVAPFAGITSAMDMSIGVLIACRRTAALGLALGIVVALGYMAGTALLTPDLWIEPLGALVKTGPAIVLMGVGLAMLDNR
jgi:nucleoside-diphosphate-sugar epimerase